MRKQVTNKPVIGIYLTFSVIVLLYISIFILDLKTQLGVAGGVPYILPLVITIWLPKRYIIIFAVVATILTITGFYLSDSGSPMWIVKTNRIYAFIAIWSVAFVSWKRKVSKDELQVHHDNLEQLIDNRTVKLTETVKLFEKEIIVRKQVEEDLVKSNILLNSLSEVQSDFIKNTENHVLFEGLLKTLLTITNGEYGFIGEILKDNNEVPFLKILAWTNIAWNDETRALYDKNAKGGIEFRNLESLYGAVIKTGQPVFSNSPSTDPRRCGIPKGHPPLNTFMGLPFGQGDQFLGMIGIANIPDGYDEKLEVYLKPFLNTCATIISAIQIDTERMLAEKELLLMKEKLHNQEKRAIIGNLTAGLIHEIKNQLNPIGFLELMKSSLSQEEKKDVQYILDGRDRIISLIDEIRGLVRNEDTRYSIVSYDLTDVINESFYIVKMDNAIRNIRIVADYQFTGQVLMNKDKIIQVFINLIQNSAHAIEGIENGQIIVKTEQNKEFALVRVSDNGCGIDKNILVHIWDPFFTTKGEKGTGIGLDICKRIIKGHNGTITCSSELNKGTTFTFSLPLADSK